MATAIAPPDQVVVNATPQEISVSSHWETETHWFATRILMFSFAAAVTLAIAGFLMVAIYLFLYLHYAFEAFDKESLTQLSGMAVDTMKSILVARTSLWKFILQSCGVMAGSAFGFLGFALFLIGAKGDMDAAVQDSSHKVQLQRMAPGSFVILIAAVLIGYCSIHEVKLEFTTRPGPAQAQAQSQSAAQSKQNAASSAGQNASGSAYDDSSQSGYPQLTDPAVQQGYSSAGAKPRSGAAVPPATAGGAKK